MRYCLTPGNKDDRRVVEKLVKELRGWLFGGPRIHQQTTGNLSGKKGIELLQVQDGRGAPSTFYVVRWDRVNTLAFRRTL